MFFTRGVRGAISVEEDSPESITLATSRLLNKILSSNPTLEPGNLASVFFTMTDDLSSAYPALAARQLGWNHVPLLCLREIDVDNSLPRIIRVLLHWNTNLPQSAIQHVYLDRAAALRLDLLIIPQPANDKTGSAGEPDSSTNP